MENTTTTVPASTSEPVVATAPIAEPTTTTAAVPATEAATESPSPSQEDPKPIPTSLSTDPSSSASPVTVITAAEPSPAAETQTETETKQIMPTSMALSITVLVQSGIRHTFMLDRGYLERHIVKSMTSKEMIIDPMEMTVAQLKECIWKDWRDDWEHRPASALFIRLIHYGAYLQDASPLKECRLNTDSSNVIHMAIRPVEAGDDDATQRSTKGTFGGPGGGGGTSASRGCRCVIL